MACLPTLLPIESRATEVRPGERVEYQVLDMYDRPWARIWEQYFEQDMARPESPQQSLFEE